MLTPTHSLHGQAPFFYRATIFIPETVILLRHKPRSTIVATDPFRDTRLGHSCQQAFLAQTIRHALPAPAATVWLLIKLLEKDSCIHGNRPHRAKSGLAALRSGACFALTGLPSEEMLVGMDSSSSKHTSLVNQKTRSEGACARQ